MRYYNGQGHAVLRRASVRLFPPPETGEGQGGGVDQGRAYAMLLPPIPAFPRQEGEGKSEN